jgi:hypothetical protein
MTSFPKLRPVKRAYCCNALTIGIESKGQRPQPERCLPKPFDQAYVVTNKNRSFNFLS